MEIGKTQMCKTTNRKFLMEKQKNKLFIHITGKILKSSIITDTHRQFELCRSNEATLTLASDLFTNFIEKIPLFPCNDQGNK